jgi:hypothetical protein
MAKKNTPKSLQNAPQSIPGPSLPLKLPSTYESLQRLICLLGNRTKGELGTKARQELELLIGMYPTVEQAALWKHNLKQLVKDR